MATTLSPILKLRIDSGLTADAKYNLGVIDSLGAALLSDSLDRLQIRSVSDIILTPNSADVGGSGSGGNVSIGSPDHILDSVSIYALSLTLGASLALSDVAVGGTRKLQLEYNSALSGPVDTGADRHLLIDVNGADRNLIMGGSLTTSGGDLVLALSGPTNVSLPQSGTLSTLAGTESLSNKTLDALRFFLSSRHTTLGPSQAGQSTDLTFYLPNSAGSPSQVLATDGSGNLHWVTTSGTGTVNSFTGSWIHADGTTKTISHNLGSTNIEVSILDLSSNAVIGIDSIVATDSNTITLSASEAPSATWQVTIQA